MDIFNLIFTGNITKDATTKSFEKTSKKVINFTVACNASKDKTLYLDCSYWLKLDQDPEDKLLNALLKGKSITVHSNYASIEQSEGKDGTIYSKFKVIVSKIHL